MIEINALALSVFTKNITRRRLPVGRFTVAVGGTRKRAVARGSDRVAALCSAALVAAGHYIELRRQRQARRDARGGGRAMAADKRVDARLRSVYKHLTSCVETYEGEPKAAEAQRLMDQYFPEGLGAIITAPYEEELVLAEHIAEAFSGPEARTIDDLGARMFVDALDEALPIYRAALALEDIVTATQVAEARDAMHLLMLKIMVAILADHGGDVEVLRALLAPLDDQDRRLAELYASRRRGQSTGGIDLAAADAADAARAADADVLAEGLLAAAEDNPEGELDDGGEAPVVVQPPEGDPPGLRPLDRR